MQVLDGKGQKRGCPQRGAVLSYYCYLEIEEKKKTSVDNPQRQNGPVDPVDRWRRIRGFGSTEGVR
jgi:hypothetical protein